MTKQSSLHIIVLAAGEGKRMCSALPKALHTLAGKSLLTRVLETAFALQPAAVHVVYGFTGQQVKDHCAGLAINWVEQKQQLGTGHAVLQVLPSIPDDAIVLILSSDVPLLQVNTLEMLIANHQHADLSVLLAKLPDPTGLGRIIRHSDGHVLQIIEDADTNEQQKTINEIYSGIMMASVKRLRQWLAKIDCKNAQGEYYLTDIIALAAAEQCKIADVSAMPAKQVCGINNLIELIELERYWQQQQALAFMLAGVRICDPHRFDLRGTLTCGQNVVIDVNVIFEGEVILGDSVSIAANCVLQDVKIGNNVSIKANTIIESASIGDDCNIGPFARIRPGTYLDADVKIGNFVEIKKSLIGSGTKISHISYIGDADIGKRVTIGAGTITCNYDGANKHQTIIKDEAFIGSDTQLIAPVIVGEKATIGAGSTIRKDAPPGQLTLSAVEQKSLPGWQRPVAKKKQD